MKNLIFSIILLITFSINSKVHGQNSCSTNTPNGSTVNMVCFYNEPLSNAQIAAFNRSAEQQFPNASRLNNASAKYNCHSFAWYMTSYYNSAWMNSPNDDRYWQDGSYSQTNFNNSTHISYVYGDHSGRNYPNYVGWIYSKWGQLPPMIHWWNDAPYNSSQVNLYR